MMVGIGTDSETGIKIGCRDQKGDKGIIDNSCISVHTLLA